MNVEAKLKGDTLSIYIDNLPHLMLKTPIIGFQSWNRENRWWEIEFYTKDKTILLQYDCFGKWTQILKELDKCLRS